MRKWWEMAEGRKSSVTRETRETKVSVEVDLDGQGAYEIRTPYSLVNHLVSQLSVFAKLDLKIDASGDLLHHVVEDVGITLGEAIGDALGDRGSVRRFGWAAVPMEDSMSLVAVDLVRRPYFVLRGFSAKSDQGSSEAYATLHLLRALAFTTPMCLHVNVLYWEDEHHALEATFKALGLAFGQASELRRDGPVVLSSKGSV